MKKLGKRIGFCFFLAALVWVGTLISDRQRLNDELVRLHVVAASDSEADQELKLRVRDAVLESLTAAMENVADADAAKAYIQSVLPEVEAVANEVLRAAGCDETAVASFAREMFDTRAYDTFTLPAGIYDALRITIGDGEGENWWCVVFPTFCLGATTENFADIAAGAGFPDSLTGALTGEGYEIRLFFLEAMGKLENFLHGG